MVTLKESLSRTGTSGSARSTQELSSDTSQASTGSTASTATSSSIDSDFAEKALGRLSRHADVFGALPSSLENKRIVVTGSCGSLGSYLIEFLELYTDVWGVDTTNHTGNVLAGIGHVIDELEPDIIFHLAAAKHAPVGEIEPYETARLNIYGTHNVVCAAKRHNARVVLASTCKAINPETAYGASKLVAERIVLNYEHGSVARFHNVVETQGNVFELWESIPAGEKIPVTKCVRYFLTKDEALSLLLYAATAEPGLYSFKGGNAQPMKDIAARLYGEERIHMVNPRRGDRIVEPLKHEHEIVSVFDGPIIKLEGPHAGA